MYLSISQGFNTPLLYTAQIAVRSVGAITPNNLTNSISLIHTLAASDGTATLPHPSIVIVVRFIGCTLYGETLAHFLFKGGNVIVKFCVRHFRINLCGGYLRMPQNLAHAFYRHTVIQCQNSEGVAAYME